MPLSHIFGLPASPRTIERAAVLRLSETHFLTDRGPLCGAKPPYCWSDTDAEATCDTCRAMLAARARDRRPAAMQTVVVTIGRIRPPDER